MLYHPNWLIAQPTCGDQPGQMILIFIYLLQIDKIRPQKKILAVVSFFLQAKRERQKHVKQYRHYKFIDRLFCEI